MKLFVAIPITEDLAQKIAALQSRLEETRAHVQWVAPANYHLTVKFIGEVDDSLLPEIAARVARAAAQVPAFPLEIEGLGHFPNRGPAKVIIAHGNSPDFRLTKLHRLVDSAIGGMGLPLDSRELIPHVTLGRVESQAGANRLLRLITKHETDLIGAMTVTEVVLFQSEFGLYKKMTTAKLAPAKSPLTPGHQTLR